MTRDAAADALNFVRLSGDVVLGEGVRIFSFVNAYGCEIGDETMVGAFVEIQRGAKIGKTLQNLESLLHLRRGHDRRRMLRRSRRDVSSTIEIRRP